MCVWFENLKVTNTDKRVYELLESCFHGLSKAIVAQNDMVAFTFPHWYVQRDKPKAKKRRKVKLGARLLLHPETEEPWLLLFDPEFDFKDQLKEGKPDGNREIATPITDALDSPTHQPGSGLDQSHADD
jgi:hypothetical protein